MEGTPTPHRLRHVNDTHERALINSFNFTVTGWGIKANLTSGDISQDLSFWNETAIESWHEDDQHDLSHPHVLPEDREVLLHVETCQKSRATRVRAGVLQRHRAGRLEGVRRRQLRALQHLVSLPAFLLQRVHHGLHLRALGPRPFGLGQHLSRDA